MGRTLKAEIAKALAGDAPFKPLAEAYGRKAASPLIGRLCAGEEKVRWRAVQGLGLLTAGLFSQEPEQARVILRRLWWMLNDESGGIGWGAPEALAEVLAREGGRLADEFAKLLTSLVNPDGNYLELAALRRGAVWGIGRLARVRPDLLTDAAPFLEMGLASEDTEERGLAAWALAAFSSLSPEAVKALEGLGKDCGEVRVFDGEELATRSVSALAAAALAGRAKDS